MCVCVCRLLQLLKDPSKSFYRLLVTFSWISIRGLQNKLMLRSRVMASFAYFEGHCRLVRLLHVHVATSLDIINLAILLSS